MIGRWSTRRPWLAISCWLAFVALAIGSLVATGTQTLDNGALGESARGYRLIDENGLWPAPHELAYLHSDTFARFRIHRSGRRSRTSSAA